MDTDKADKTDRKDDLMIVRILVNDQDTPLGTDIRHPVFSWILESQEKNTMQKRVRICVGEQPGSTACWDSGFLETDCSTGIRYEGCPLRGRTRYYVDLQVEDTHGRTARAQTWFETGLMDPGIQAWNGASWIGAPEYAVMADTIGAFVLECAICIGEGFRGGLVFGADDPRLWDRYKNEMLLEGHSEIRYILDLEPETAVLEIRRIGYAPDDREDIPFARIPLTDIHTGERLITKENRRKVHRLRIEVTGNGAYTWLDGHPVDESVRHASYGDVRSPRILNPLGGLDVVTYPRLNRVGYYAPAGSRVHFPEGIRMRYLRAPGHEFAALDPDGKLVDAKQKDVILLSDPSCHALPMLRHSFTVSEIPVRARMYATARGIYRCMVNGQETDDAFFSPGASQYDHHLMYQTYDVTDRIRQGRNVLGCILASGWWSDAFSFRVDNYNYWGDRPSFLGMLVLTFADGSEQVHVTDPETWEYFGEGPFLYAGFFNGERYDARREFLLKDFFSGRQDMDGLKKTERILPWPIADKEGIFPGAARWPALNGREPDLTGDFQAPVRAVRVLTAVSMTQPREGVYIYDLGQEIAGIPRITFREERGHRITIRYGEMLYPDLERYEGLAGLMLQANLRDASSTDIYICSGGGKETWQPSFTFHGYRYIEISGAANPPAPEEVKSLLLSSVPEMTEPFTCSDPLVNRLAENVRFSQLSNFISIPTDCPQRNERMGWLGDTHAFCKTANLQSRVKNFYLRNLQAMADLQSPDGRLPVIAPFGGGFGGITYESAMILVVRELYLHYDDLQIVRAYYPSMDRWMHAMEAMGFPGQPEVYLTAWLGDWLATDETDPYLIFNAFYFRDARYMAFFAGLLGLEDDEKRYADIAEQSRAYWNRTFVEDGTGRTKGRDGSICDSQGSYAIGLDCGVFSEFFREAAFEHLAEKTAGGGYTVRTGFFGTGALNPMLSEGGHTDAAYRCLTGRAYPGWLYPVTQGATTVWERWNSFTHQEGFGEHNSMNSFNHYSLGSVVSWLYEYVLGIRRDEAHPGYRHFYLRPEIGMFSFAEGCIQTPRGKIWSAWTRKDGKITYRCRIPVNTTAELTLGELEKHLGSGAYVFEIPDGEEGEECHE